MDTMLEEVKENAVSQNEANEEFEENLSHSEKDSN